MAQCKQNMQFCGGEEGEGERTTPPTQNPTKIKQKVKKHAENRHNAKKLVP